MRALVLVALAMTACGGSFFDCPPCAATVTASVATTLTTDQLDGATAQICVNRDCATGLLDTELGSSIGTLTGLATGDVDVEVQPDGGKLVITFVLPPDGTLFTPLDDGDVYHATLWPTAINERDAKVDGSESSVLLDVSGTASYTDEAGSDCPTLGGLSEQCLGSSITMM